MCTKYFADGDVHKYFNPYDSPYDSYINFMNVLANLRTRCSRQVSLDANTVKNPKAKVSNEANNVAYKTPMSKNCRRQQVSATASPTRTASGFDAELSRSAHAVLVEDKAQPAPATIRREPKLKRCGTVN